MIVATVLLGLVIGASFAAVSRDRRYYDGWVDGYYARITEEREDDDA